MIGDVVLVKNEEGIFCGTLERYYHDGGVTVMLKKYCKIGSKSGIEFFDDLDYFDNCFAVIKAEKGLIEKFKILADCQE